MDVYGTYQGKVVLYGRPSIEEDASNDGTTTACPVANAIIALQDNDRPSDWLAPDLVASGYKLGVLSAGVFGDPASDAAFVPGGADSGVTRINRIAS